MAILKRVVAVLSSVWLGLVTLFLLLVLTYLGTVEQIEHGLFATQQKYFNSLWLIHEFRLGDSLTLPLPLPGVYGLLIVFTINLVFGAILRFRKGWNHIGVLIVHCGILFFLLGGLITFKWSTDGHLTLYEGQASNEFQSYYDWELMIAESGGAGALVIPGESFKDLTGDAGRTFTSGTLPFSVTLSNFMRNSAPAMPGSASAGEVAELQPEAEAERNVAAVRVSIDGENIESASQTLWGMAGAPSTFTVAGTTWTMQLQRRRWQLPFTVHLDNFERELHPGTSMAASFSSDVTVTEPNATQKAHISMNKPLRYKGYTLFQASWGPQNARPGERLFSSLAVVRNPADQFPVYGLTIITIGLTLHFCYRLFLYLRTEARKAA